MDTRIKTFPSHSNVLFPSLPLPQWILVYVICWSIKGIFLQSWRWMICLDKVFLLPVLVPGCSESLFQPQPGKDPLYSTVSCACRNCYLWVKLVGSWKNTASNLDKSVEEMSHSILAVTREIQVLSFLSASYAPLDYASLSPFTLFSTLFNFFRLTPGKTFHFLMDSLTELFWLKSLCRTLQKWNQNITILRPHAFPAHWCPLSLNYSIHFWLWGKAGGFLTNPKSDKKNENQKSTPECLSRRQSDFCVKRMAKLKIWDLHEKSSRRFFGFFLFLSFLSQWDKFHFYFSSSVKHEEPAERSVGSEWGQLTRER